jgi:hypothetical protein
LGFSILGSGLVVAVSLGKRKKRNHYSGGEVEIGFFVVFPTDYPIPEYFFMTNPMVILIFSFRRRSIKDNFLLKFYAKRYKISKKEFFVSFSIKFKQKVNFDRTSPKRKMSITIGFVMKKQSGIG